MNLYDCQLVFHENLFYETRTMGRFYETGRLLHNIALSYALGFAQTDYYHADAVPGYAKELAAVNDAGVYVTPARGENVSFAIHTFKFGEEKTSVYMQQLNANIPTYGRAKEVAVGSRFRFGVLSERELDFPRWIRMGLWMSKARLTVSAPVTLSEVAGEAAHTVNDYPLNPADLPETAALKLFDLVAMRPSNLVENAELVSQRWWHWNVNGRDLFLPAGMRYRVADVQPQPPKKRRGT